MTREEFINGLTEFSLKLIECTDLYDINDILCTMDNFRISEKHTVTINMECDRDALSGRIKDIWLLFAVCVVDEEGVIEDITTEHCSEDISEKSIREAAETIYEYNKELFED